MTSDKLHNQQGRSRQQLTPPGPSPDDSGKRGRGIVLWLLLLFTLLMSGAAAVLFFLPDRQTEKNPPISQAADKEQEPPVQEVVENQQREHAAKARERGLALRIKAESQNIAQWGGEKYQAVTSGFTEADELFAGREYAAATIKYEQTTAHLKELFDSGTQIFTMAIEAGRQALAEEKLEEAEANFKLALSIDPDSEAAHSGLEKVERLATVLDLYEKGRSLDKAGKLEEAGALFAKALALHSNYKPLLEAKRRTEEKLNEEIFQAEMNTALSAIDSQHFSQARDSIGVLKEIGIHQQQVEQTEKLFREKQTRAFVAQQRGVADRYREAEEWQAALKVYRKIRSVAPQALFAAAGEEEAEKRAKLDNSLRERIAQPHRLQDKEQRLQAAQLLAYANRINPRGPRLQAQIDMLDKQIVDAGTPANVVLESDNLTEVTVYHVGRLGRFYTKEVQLIPGRYTVVGARAGYRDVRKTMVINPGSGDLRFVIRCEEAL